ncbi:MAG: pyridoxamine 5'-phosphate oxidase family protein [Acidimicrobiaceae bacterium]|nr:pyridoxamine 5'-phosphate oxidase family protein [Acidimicrobiaceae bacterium]
MADVDLSGDIAEAINGAAAAGTAIVIGYVDAKGAPSLSFRGSTQVYSKDQIGVWARNPDEGLPANVKERPQVSLLYYNRQTPGPFFLSIKGRARVAPEANQHVYDHMIKGEQDRDPERKGVAILVDVDSVTGAGPDGRINLERAK